MIDYKITNTRQTEWPWLIEITLAALVGLALLVAAAKGGETATVTVTVVVQPQPVLVLVGASWCPACKQLRANLDSQRVAYRYIDWDRDPNLAWRYAGGYSIPVVIWYESESRPMVWRRLVGAHPVARVLQFIRGNP